MSKWLFLCCVFPLWLTAAEPVVIRTSVQPEQAWQGQRVRLLVEVLGKDGWAQIPNMPALKVAGAYVLPPESQGVRTQEQIDGAAYTGQRYELSVYPQQGGKIQIPETPVQVRLSAFGSGTEPKLTDGVLPATAFTSKTPPGAEGLEWLVSTTQFSASQTWSSDATELKVGEALKRQITLTASDVSGMAFAPLKFPAMQGLGIYPSEPSVEDKRDRGSLNGERQEEVTYIFQGAGKAEIPAIELVWWDVQNEELKTVVLEGRSVIVSGGPTTSYKQEAGTKSWIAWILLPVALLAGCLWWKRAALQSGWHALQQARSEREQVYFDRFSEAAGTGDIRHTVAALMQWLDRINTSSTPAQLEQFLQRYAEGEYDLENLLHQPRELYQLMVQARKTWLKAEKKRVKVEALLPELNG